MNQALQFEFLAAAVGVFTLVILYLAYRTLASSGWVMGWIQGNVGLALLLFTGVLVLAIMDIRTYRPMFDNIPIATLSLHTLEPGKHQLRLVNNKGIEQSYSIAGDEYQLVINQFRWATRFSGMGMGHGYRIDHLVSIDNSRGIKTKAPVSSSDYLDIWRFFHNNISQDFFIAASTVETLPHKIVDGGMYELIPDAFEIKISALNQVAKEADRIVVTDAVIPVEESIVSGTTVSPETAAQPVVKEPVPVVTSTPTVVAPVQTKPPVKQEEVPGAHIQATPAKLIEKPATQQAN